MAFQITFLPDNKTVSVEAGTTVLQAEVQAGLRPDAPCGGKGTCGKCRVMVLSGEHRGSGPACLTPVTSDMVVQLPHNTHHQVLQSHYLRPVPCRPGFMCLALSLGEPTLQDTRSDWERVQAAIAEELSCPPEEIRLSLDCLRYLHKTLEQSGYAPYVLLYQNQVLQVRSAPFSPLLAAYDIGTTSVVCYLMDGISGETLHVESMLNRQVSYGADVISRAEFAINGGLDEISAVIRQELNDLLELCCKAVERTREDVVLLSIAGNTCMHHLFSGIQPAALLVPPYFPEVREALELPAARCGLPAGQGAILRLLPVIAGFVGADTSAALLATSFDELTELSLMVDIGTNGEMVLGDGRRRIACSTAAGPALEGAKISCGMRGAEGAIDHVALENGDIQFTTIGGKTPEGICGSGLIDLVAVLLRCGVINKRGRMAKPEEMAHLPALQRRLGRDEHGAFFLLAEGKDTAAGTPIVLTQTDIREVQLAKGAIAAGIMLMCDTLGTTPQAIQRVFIAGAFGNYMDAESACAIGMFPEIDPERVKPVGNAAGAGAQLSAMSQEEYRRCSAIAEKTEFLELALHPKFQKAFIHHLDF